MRNSSLSFSLLVSLFLLVACQNKTQPKFDGAQIRDYASALYNRELYQQSVQQYVYYLDHYDLDDVEAARVNFQIGNIYFERVHDYENALSYYLKIKHLYPESDLLDQVNKKMVECLERLQRSADAQQVLEEAALLDPSQRQSSRPGTVIAKIGKREITTGDLDHEISLLHPSQQAQLTDKSKKVEFLKDFIARELLYNTAKRKGLEKDKEVIEATFRAKQSFMVDKLLAEEISQQEKYADKDKDGKVIAIKSLDEVKAQVMQDLIREKQKEAYDRLVRRMMRAEAVKIFDDKVK
ncbi:MAG: tol-pal system YbgF family protein [bacterium]